jgi:hypothetical protein
VGYDSTAIRLIREWDSRIHAELQQFDNEVVEELFPDLVELKDSDTRSLSDGASEQEINRTESRLGTKLPEDYKALVRVRNGWLAPGLLPPGNRVQAVEEIDWFRNVNPRSCADWAAESVMRTQIGVYGDYQDPVLFCREHLQSCVAISTQYGSGVYLLNTAIVKDGCYESWYMDDHLPGAVRFRSAFELFENELHRSLEEIRSLLAS